MTMDAVKAAVSIFKQRLVTRLKAKRAGETNRCSRTSWYASDGDDGGDDGDAWGGVYEEIIGEDAIASPYEDFESCRRPLHGEAPLPAEQSQPQSLESDGGGSGSDDCSASLDSLVALYAYAAQEDGQLSFERGETLDVILDARRLWWLASNSRGQVGLVPSNYLVASAASPPSTGGGGAQPTHRVKPPQPSEQPPPPPTAAKQPPQPKPKPERRRSFAPTESQPHKPAPPHKPVPPPKPAPASVPAAAAAAIGRRASTAVEEAAGGDGGACAYATLDTGGLDYFHGGIDRDQCERLLVRDGDFLLRDSRCGELTLSVKGRDRIHHFLVATRADGAVTIGHLTFPLFSKLVDYYHKHAVYKSDSERLLLANPVSR